MAEYYVLVQMSYDESSGDWGDSTPEDDFAEVLRREFPTVKITARQVPPDVAGAL